jgi:hypothetical protein
MVAASALTILDDALAAIERAGQHQAVGKRAHTEHLCAAHTRLIRDRGLAPRAEPARHWLAVLLDVPPSRSRRHNLALAAYATVVTRHR